MRRCLDLCGRQLGGPNRRCEDVDHVPFDQKLLFEVIQGSVVQGNYFAGWLLVKKSTRLWGAVGPKHSSSTPCASTASDALRGKRSFSYAASAASMSSGLAAIAFPSSAPSNIARLAPSPDGIIRCAASPSNVTPGTRAHLCSTGSA